MLTRVILPTSPCCFFFMLRFDSKLFRWQSLKLRRFASFLSLNFSVISYPARRQRFPSLSAWWETRGNPCFPIVHVRTTRSHVTFVVLCQAKRLHAINFKMTSTRRFLALTLILKCIAKFSLTRITWILTFQLLFDREFYQILSDNSTKHWDELSHTWLQDKAVQQVLRKLQVIAILQVNKLFWKNVNRSRNKWAGERERVENTRFSTRHELNELS